MRINRNETSAGNQTPRPAPQPQQKAAPAQQPREKKEEPETPRPARKEKPKEKKKERRPRRRVPVGCVILVIFVALLAFGGFQVMRLYDEVDGGSVLGEEQTITVERAPRWAPLPPS